MELGNVEISDRTRQMFTAVARTDTAIKALIQRSLRRSGGLGRALGISRSLRSPTAVRTARILGGPKATQRCTVSDVRL